MNSIIECTREDVLMELQKKPAGTVFAVDVPEDSNHQLFATKLRTEAGGVGLNLSIKLLGSIMLVCCRKSAKPRPVRHQEIGDALINLERPSAIARRLSISRQRVHQIQKRYFNSLPILERHQALLDWIQPYVDADLDKIFCPMCGDEMDVTTKKLICPPCKTVISLLRQAKTRLRLWKRGGHKTAPHELLQAASLIRRYNIAPEHFRSIKPLESSGLLAVESEAQYGEKTEESSG